MAKAPKTKRKTVYYRRASFQKVTKTSLETLVKRAHKKYTTSAQRTFQGNYGLEIQCAKSLKTQHGMVLHITSSIPDQPASAIAKPSKAKDSNTQDVPAPEGSDFLVGDIFVLIKGNHVMLCQSLGAREALAHKYFSEILIKLGEDRAGVALDLEKIANYDKVKMIQKEGVRAIELDANLYEASVAQMERDNKKKKKKASIVDIPGMIAGDILKVFATDKTLNEIKAAENVSMKLSIRFDGKEAMKHRDDDEFGKAGKSRLKKASKMVVDDFGDRSLDGFKIETFSGNIISSDEIKIAAPYSIKVSGNSLNVKSAWKALVSFYNKLDAQGILSQ